MKYEEYMIGANREHVETRYMIKNYGEPIEGWATSIKSSVEEIIKYQKENFHKKYKILITSIPQDEFYIDPTESKVSIIGPLNKREKSDLKKIIKEHYEK